MFAAFVATFTMKLSVASGKWEDLPADWKCPLCGAGKDAFKPKEEKSADG